MHPKHPNSLNGIVPASLTNIAYKPQRAENHPRDPELDGTAAEEKLLSSENVRGVASRN